MLSSAGGSNLTCTASGASECPGRRDDDCSDRAYDETPISVTAYRESAAVSGYLGRFPVVLRGGEPSLRNSGPKKGMREALLGALYSILRAAIWRRESSALVDWRLLVDISGVS